MTKSVLVTLLAGFLALSLGCPAARAAELDWVRVGTSGKTIIFLFKDSGSAEKAVVKTIDLDAHPQLTINGTQTIALDRPIYQKAGKDWLGPVGLPYVIYPLFNNVLKAGDKLSVSAPANWVSCNGGAIGALQNVAVENYVGKSLLPAPPQEYKMAVGFNLCPEEWGAAYCMRANLMRQSSWYSAKRADKGPVVLGANGLPASVEDEPVLNLRCAITTPGDFTLMWDGKDQLEIINSGFKKTTDTLSGGIDNKRVYAKSGNQANTIQVKFLGTDVRHLRVYPPGVKTDGSQYFGTDFLRMLRGAKSIRFMTEMWAFNSDINSFDDLRKDSEETKLPDRKITAQVVKIEPYDNKDHFFMAEHRAYFKCTTAEPHHFQDGSNPTLDLKLSLTMSDGQTLKFPNGNLFAHVLSPTEFAASFYVPGNDITIQAAQEVQGTATVVFKKPAMWLSEMVDLVNTIDGCDMWMSIPFLMDDDGVRKMFEAIAGRLAKGRKVHLEYSNEVWNWAGYWGTDYCWAMSAIDNDPNVKKGPGFAFEREYTKRAAQMWTIARAAFHQAGRDEHDIIGVIGAQVMNGGVGHLTYAKNANVTVDEFAVAPYWHVEPNEPYLKDVLAKVTDVDQLCDIADMSVQYRNSIDRFMQKTVDSLKQLGYQGKLVCYEGGPEMGCFSATPDADSGKLSQGWSRHPRMAAWLRYYMQRMQDTYGVTLFEDFVLSQSNFPGNGPRQGTMLWPVYRQWNQLDGTGDGTDGLFNNLSDLQSKDCVSVMGYAFHDWLAKNPRDPK